MRKQDKTYNWGRDAFAAGEFDDLTISQTPSANCLVFVKILGMPNKLGKEILEAQSVPCAIPTVLFLCSDQPKDRPSSKEMRPKKVNMMSVPNITVHSLTLAGREKVGIPPCN